MLLQATFQLETAGVRLGVTTILRGMTSLAKNAHGFGFARPQAILSRPGNSPRDAKGLALVQPDRQGRDPGFPGNFSGAEGQSLVPWKLPRRVSRARKRSCLAPVDLAAPAQALLRPSGGGPVRNKNAFGRAKRAGEVPRAPGCSKRFVLLEFGAKRMCPRRGHIRVLLWAPKKQSNPRL